jgi:hypothetical protein
LIISPYFPPSNAADMQRVRMSLPYFAEFGWQAEVVTVDERYSDLVKDELLTQSLPAGLKIHKVNALSKNVTSRFGLGSLALRSLWFYRQKVNQLLKTGRFDLIYFSTTQFPVCVLGAYWKKRFGVPYVIDMQDPWHSEYYRDKPKDQRPPKHWFSYRLNKYLEPIAMKAVGGLISVSEKYISDLQNRYPRLKNIPTATITFGAFELDHQIAQDNVNKFKSLLTPGVKNLVYIGRGGADMQKALNILFEAVKRGQEKYFDLFKKLKISFIGTSYAPAGHGKKTILPLAQQFEVEDKVTEVTDRISYYHTMLTLQQADALFIPGSDSEGYTASKMSPYLLTNKPLLAIIDSKSPAANVLGQYGVEHVYYFDKEVEATVAAENFLTQLLNNTLTQPEYSREAIEKYAAVNITHKQCDLFNKALNE